MGSSARSSRSRPFGLGGFVEPQDSGSVDFTPWLVALQNLNLSVVVGAKSDRLIGELKLDK